MLCVCSSPATLVNILCPSVFLPVFLSACLPVCLSLSISAQVLRENDADKPRSVEQRTAIRNSRRSRYFFWRFTKAANKFAIEFGLVQTIRVLGLLFCPPRSRPGPRPRPVSNTNPATPSLTNKQRPFLSPTSSQLLL
ncbi:hypothetical protein B0T24DRAFT_211912 [Lasiosphaeria ovina]|uniref:Uncharacterized protein n=1 Tax=Lasiosphaeria ovina TaxID=92902 RepID=A0AAE0KHB7_9PEZI|nr:hypothetical protein B0T24DRAFT_211912 [Lasiosphaeria ovina]